MAREDLDFCYLTTVGRKSGLARTIEIWFGRERDTVYLLSGGGDEAHRRSRGELLGVLENRAALESGVHVSPSLTGARFTHQ